MIGKKLQPVPYLSKLEGNQLQPGQSLIIRGYIIGNLKIFLFLHLFYKAFIFLLILFVKFDLNFDFRLIFYIFLPFFLKKKEFVKLQFFIYLKNDFYERNLGRSEFIVNLTSGAKVEKEDENDTLDNRLLVLRANITEKKVYLNACIDGHWGRLVFSFVFLFFF